MHIKAFCICLIPTEVKESARAYGIGVTDGYEPPRGC